MSNQRYERVSSRPSLATQRDHSGEHCKRSSTNRVYLQISPNDEEDHVSPVAPTSPPPSFRSRNSSPTSRHSRVDQNLADTFDADGSDSDEENDGDDRQRLMRGTPSTSSTEQSTTQHSGDGRPAVVESRSTYTPVFAPAVTGRVYGGGTGSDGVFANLSAKPERGEKLDEHPPVRTCCAGRVGVH
jgi:hypothetical protein